MNISFPRERFRCAGHNIKIDSSADTPGYNLQLDGRQNIHSFVKDLIPFLEFFSKISLFICIKRLRSLRDRKLDELFLNYLFEGKEFSGEICVFTSCFNFNWKSWTIMTTVCKGFERLLTSLIKKCICYWIFGRETFRKIVYNERQF